MLVFEQKLNISIRDAFPLNYNQEEYAFFDIETTGFHAESTYLYLIGCIYIQEGNYYLKQWFSEGVSDEKNILTAFLSFLSNYRVLVHFNGSTFDIPYLDKKCKQYNILSSFDQLDQIDLYKLISPYKKVLQLSSCRQKAIEQFLHINRDDLFDGGELIQVYANYIGQRRIELLKTLTETSNGAVPPQSLPVSPAHKGKISSIDIKKLSSGELLFLLLLHNAEDVMGMIRLTPIFSYINLFSKPVDTVIARIDTDYLVLNLQNNIKYPKDLSLSTPSMKLVINKNEIVLTIRFFVGELKHFYEDIENYYYLPLEDTALHKSVAEFVDKNFRTKATKSNCYVKRVGNFIPAFDIQDLPLFKLDHRSKNSFIEVTEELLNHSAFFSKYALLCLHSLLNEI